MAFWGNLGKSFPFVRGRLGAIVNLMWAFSANDYPISNEENYKECVHETVYSVHSKNLRAEMYKN